MSWHANWVIIVGMLAGGGLADSARADVWACKDRDGSVRFADRKLPGLRCRLYAKTPQQPEAVGETAAGTSAGGTSAGRREARTVERAFGRPRVLGGYAPIPTGETRTGGDEPADVAGRERLYATYFIEAAELYDLPVNFLKGVARVESAFRYRATSEAGAMGVMQLMPSVVREMGVQNPWDPRANILGGARLLRVLADRFAGDMVKVLAAYHAGSGAVSSADGIPYEATESYVRSVLDRYYEYRSRSEFSSRSSAAEPPEDLEEIEEPE